MLLPVSINLVRFESALTQSDSAITQVSSAGDWRGGNPFFFHSTKISFQDRVTKVWSRKPIFKTGLQHF